MPCYSAARVSEVTAQVNRSERKSCILVLVVGVTVDVGGGVTVLLVVVVSCFCAECCKR